MTLERHRRQRDGDRRRRRRRRRAPAAQRRAVEGRSSCSPTATRTRASISPEYAAHLAHDGRREGLHGPDRQRRRGRRPGGHGPLRPAASTCAHRFPVNPELLQKMAQETGGEAFVATDGKALADSMHAILDHLEKTRFEASIASIEDLFPFLLVPGVALVGARRAPPRVAPPEVPVKFADDLLPPRHGCSRSLVAARCSCSAGSRPRARGRALRRAGARARARRPSDPAKRRAWKGVLLVLATSRSRSSRARGRSTAGARGSSRRRTSMWSSCSTTRRACTRATSRRRASCARRSRWRASSRISPGARFGAVAFAGEPMSFPLTATAPRSRSSSASSTRTTCPSAARRSRARSSGRASSSRAIRSRRTTSASSCSSPTARISRAIRSRRRATIGAEGTTIDVVQIGGRAPERDPRGRRRRQDRRLAQRRQRQAAHDRALAPRARRSSPRSPRRRGGEIVRAEQGHDRASTRSPPS